MMRKNYDALYAKVGLKYDRNVETFKEYSKRRDIVDTCVGDDRVNVFELISGEIIRSLSQIDRVEREIRSLGISWFSEKRQKRRQLKVELQLLRDRVRWLQQLRSAISIRL